MLGGCVLDGCVLSDCVLDGCVLSDCALGGCALGGCALGGCALGGCVPKRLDCGLTEITGCVIKGWGWPSELASGCGLSIGCGETTKGAPGFRLAAEAAKASSSIPLCLRGDER